MSHKRLGVDAATNQIYLASLCISMEDVLVQ